MNDLLQQLRIIEQAHQHAANFQKSLLLLRALKTGQVSLDNVVVSDDGWTIAPKAEMPAVLLEGRNGDLPQRCTEMG